MFKAGIVDPTKVTRSALQNAASIAGLMLTTEAMITNIKDDEKESGAAGRGIGRAETVSRRFDVQSSRSWGPSCARPSGRKLSDARVRVRDSPASRIERGGSRTPASFA